MSRQLINQRTGKLLYDSFVPRPLQEIEKELVFSFDTFDRLIHVNNILSQLNKLINSKEDIQEDLELFINTEAFYACQIPGIRYSIEDKKKSLFRSAQFPSNEIENYVQGIKYGIEHLDSIKFDVSLVKHLSMIVLKDETDNPEEFRQTSKPYSLLKRHSYIPTAPNEIESVLTTLMEYMESQNTSNILVRASLIAYQFLTIFPFPAGNFRIMNLLVTLYLLKNKVVVNTILFISAYLCYHFKQFLEYMDDIRDHGDFENYIMFFLRAIGVSANVMIERVSETLELHNQNINKIVNSECSKTIKMNLLQILKYVKNNPVVTIKDTCIALNKSYPTMDNAFLILTEMNILKIAKNCHRNRVYVYDDVFHNLNV